MYKEKTNKKLKKNPEPSSQEAETNDTTTKLATASASAPPTAPPAPAAAAAAKRERKMAHAAYVEDIGEDGEYESWDEYDGQSDDESPFDPPPEAPTPPSAALHEDDVNVFDFLVATGQTPNASKTNLPRDRDVPSKIESKSLVRFEQPEESLEDHVRFLEAAEDPLISYGSGPLPHDKFITPGTKPERRRSKDGEAKKDKKRKRLHLDVSAALDQVMTDAPPVLHSGLTGGLKGLLRSQLPPSPDYSGADMAEPSPASPLKKSKHSKHSKNGQISTSIFGLISSKPRTKKHKKSHKSSPGRHRDEKTPKLIEYRPQSKDGKSDAPNGAENQLVMYKPRADVFLSFVDKGPESSRGCSMNKALKRFHRNRKSSDTGMGKGKEEKELFRSLRLRRNDRGEIVLFSEDFDLDDADL